MLWQIVDISEESWLVKTWDGEQSNDTGSQDERRRLVARRVFEALCAQYPEKYIALVQSGDATDQRIVDVITGQSPGQQPPITV